MFLRQKVIVALALLITAAVIMPGCTSPQQPVVSAGIPQSYDVVVWGSTTSAVAAALEASREGAYVLLLTQDLPLLFDLDFLWKEGLLLPYQEEEPREESEVEEDGEDDMEEDSIIYPSLEQLILEAGSGLNDPRLVATFEEELPRLVNWLEDWDNSQLQQVGNQHPLYPRLHLLAGGPDQEELLRAEILGYLEKSSVILQEDIVINEIKFNQEGEISSLLVDAEEEEIEIFTRSFIIASGGFSGSTTLLQQYAPRPFPHHSLGKTQGSSLSLAEKLAIDPVQVNFFHSHFYQQGFPDNNFHPGLLPSEGLFLLNQGQYVSFNEFLEEMTAYLSAAGEDNLYFLFPLPEGEGVKEPYLISQGLIDPKIISSTEELWQLENQGYEASMLREIASIFSPPYGLIPLEEGVSYTQGGIPVDGKTRVLLEGEAIPGLYAAGEAAGGFYGRSLLQGSPSSHDLIFGLIAGKEGASWSRR